jgi:hypothetical protein
VGFRLAALGRALAQFYRGLFGRCSAAASGIAPSPTTVRVHIRDAQLLQ